jgi:hypothetical protein
LKTTQSTKVKTREQDKIDSNQNNHILKVVSFN